MIFVDKIIFYSEKLYSIIFKFVYDIEKEGFWVKVFFWEMCYLSEEYLE